jgi:hypothetical protein
MRLIILLFMRAACLEAATGNVVYTGNAIGTAGGFGTTLSNVFDRNLGTDWITPTQSGGYAGTQFASPVQLTGYRIAAGVASDQSAINRLAQGVIQASNDCTFATGVVTLDTLPVMPFYARYTQSSTGGLHARNQRPIAPSAAYSCYRFQQTHDYGHISELQWIGAAGATGVAARPVMPVISPGSGAFTAGSATITITSQTTSAVIYYTTDGTAPSNTNGMVYAGPFTLAVAAGTVLQAVAYDGSLSTPLSDVAVGHFRNYAFKPDDDWYDDDGVLIEAHSADISGPFNGRYYWVGQFTNKANDTACCAGADTGTNNGIWMYSSVDLLNWHYEGQILDNGQSIGVTNSPYVIRPHILYNAANNNYVLWAAMYAGSNSERAGVATASNITGPWTWQTVTLNPDGNGIKDFSLFQDTDGTAYVIYLISGAGSYTISRLTSNYQASSGVSLVGVTPAGEAPVLFKRGGVYFYVGSLQRYYDSVNGPFNLRYAVCSCSSPLQNSWSPLSNLFATQPAANQPYNGQSSSMLVVAGRRDAYMLLTDFWNPTSLYSSRQSWIPLTFPTGTTVQGNTPAVFDLSLWPMTQRLFPLPSAIGR